MGFRERVYESDAIDSALRDGSNNVAVLVRVGNMDRLLQRIEAIRSYACVGSIRMRNFDGASKAFPFSLLDHRAGAVRVLYIDLARKRFLAEDRAGAVRVLYIDLARKQFLAEDRF